MDAQEDVLRKIFDPGAILYHPGNHGEDQILVPVHQFLKGSLIVLPATLDELALVDGLHADTVFEHAPPRFVSTLRPEPSSHTHVTQIRRRSGLINSVEYRWSSV